MKVLYDGWPLAYLPNSPQAIHLLTLLEAHPPEIPTRLALPGESFHPLPAWLETEIASSADTESGRLHWEQRGLPGLARDGGTDRWVVHTTGRSLSLFGGGREIASPAGFPDGSGAPTAAPARGFTSRLRLALSEGGLSRARALLWPSDLPADGSYPAAGPPLHRLPPCVHPAFSTAANENSQASPELAPLDMPETYILYHGPTGEPALRRLLDAWSWAAGAIGEYYPLLILDCTSPEQETLAALLAEYRLTGTARPLPRLSLPALAAVYRGCTALFHPLEVSPWGGPVRLALASGRPVVGLESERTAALVGPAAYLARPGDDYPAGRRLLGAALLTVVVEEGLAEHLSAAALQRTAAWSLDEFRRQLLEFYRHLG